MGSVVVIDDDNAARPREIRKSLGLEPGQKVQAFEYEGRVEFVPVRAAKSMRGFARGIETTVTREQDRK